MSQQRSHRYGKSTEPEFTRPGILPGFIGMVALMIGMGSFEQDWRIIVLYVVSIFALILLVFAVQARHWWWWLPLAAIAVLWNPAFPIDLVYYELWLGTHVLGAVVMAASGIMIRVPNRQQNQPRR